MAVILFHVYAQVIWQMRVLPVIPQDIILVAAQLAGIMVDIITMEHLIQMLVTMVRIISEGWS
jgi:hypothetical protein